MSNGQEQPGSPVIIADTGYKNGKAVSFIGPSVKGTGAGREKGKVRFYVPRELQRPGLSLDGNNLLIAFGSYGDIPPFHGWILAYNHALERAPGTNRSGNEHASMARCDCSDLIGRQLKRHRLGGFQLERVDRI
jgi:hypothetical protein